MSKIHELAFNAEEIDELLDSVDKKTIYQDATQSEHGLMSTTDKTKLDALPTAQQIEGSLSEKVDKVEGKGLSENDYTDAEKESVASAYHKPQNGIPKTDLDSRVQTSLDKADTALQSFTETDPTVPSWAKQPNKPSYNYSELGNTPDLSGFITKSVNDLTNYYLKSETYTKSEVAALIAAIQQFHYEIYASLPQSGEGNVLYLIGPTGTGSDRYEEYVYANNAFTKIGDTSIDLSGYVTTSALNTALADYTPSSDLAEVATSGSYNDLTNKPSIPDISGKADKVSNATNGNFAGLDANGNLTDSGYSSSDFATASQGAKADTAYQKPSSGIPKSDLSSDVQSQLNKHFKGWFDDTTVLNAKYPSPVVGDYAYVKGAESTDPAAIYECTTNGSWSDSGRTADTSNVQTFATGEEVNEVHIVNDFNSDNTTDLLGNSILKQQLVYSTPDYLKGVTFGNTTAALTIKSIVKEVWLEDNNGLITYPDKLYFVLFRNRASSGYYFQFGTSGSVIWFTVNGATKLTGVQQFSISIYSSYGSDVKLHLSVDFTEHSEDINYGLQDTCYLSPSLLNKEEPLVITTKDKVVQLNDNIDTIDEQVQKNIQSLLYENPLSGFNIPNSLKQILKSAWIQILDNSVVIPNGKKVTIKNTNDSNLSYIFSIQDEENNYIFSFTSSSKISEGVHEFALQGYSNYRNKVVLHIVVDMPETVPYTTYISDIVFSNVMTYPFSNATVKAEVFDLAKPLKGKTIVCFGDSLTEFKDSDKLGYCDYIHNISGANVINVGCGGAQIRQRTTPVLNPTNNSEGYAGMDIVNVVRAAANVEFDSTHTYRDVVQNACNYIYNNLGDDNRIIISNLLAIDWTKVNAVTILGGVNDWVNGGGNIGESGSENPNYTLGAINLIIKTLLTAYPHLSIYWMTPIVHWKPLAERTDENWSDNEKIHGVTLKELSGIIKEEAILQHIPVCDLYNTLGWNKWNFSNYFPDSDGTHPKTIEGFSAIAQKIVSFILSNRNFSSNATI